MANATYSHRNGETEPPTENGYYFNKNKEIGGWHIVFVEFDDQRPQDSAIVNFIGTDDFSLMDEYSNAHEQWWGPITPPWENGG